MVVSVLGILLIAGTVNYRDGIVRARLTSFACKAKGLSTCYVRFVADTGRRPEVLLPFESVQLSPHSDRDPRNIETEIRPPSHAYHYFQPSFSRSAPMGIFLDPFPDMSGAQLIACGKSWMQKRFPFQGSERKGCVIASRGPDKHIAQISSSIEQDCIQYDVTNGLHSSGDLFLTIPELSPIEFCPVER